MAARLKPCPTQSLFLKHALGKAYIQDREWKSHLGSYPRVVRGRWAVTHIAFVLGSAAAFPAKFRWYRIATYHVEQTSCRNSRRHWHCRAAIHPDTGAPSLVRSGVACRLRSLGRPALCRSCALAHENCPPG